MVLNDTLSLLVGLGGIFAVSVILRVAILTFEVIVGISAIRYHNVIEKAGILFKLGIVLLVLAIANITISMIITGLINALVIFPILFIVGASQNKRFEQQ